MASHNITTSADVRTGGAQSPNRTRPRGAPLSNVVIESFTPVVAAAASVSASQSVATATVTGALINGTVAVTARLPNSLLATYAVFDVPRNVVAAWTNTAIITIKGFDFYGNALTEVSASGTSHTGKKAFKYVTQITTNADITGFTAGSGGVIGLSYRPKVGGWIRGIFGENTADTSTYAAPERTASTGTTNDVRGTFAPSGTLNGTNVLTVTYIVDNGPEDKNLYGIPQFTA